MSNSNYWDNVAEAHNVVCPVCGSKASFEPIGTHLFKMCGCGHDELENLVYERLEALIVDHSPGGIKPFNTGNKPTLKVTTFKK